MTIDEFAGTTPPYNTLCGGKPCDAQVQVSGLPTGTTQANNAMQIHVIYVKDIKQSSTVICASADYEQLAAICDRVLILARGRVVDQLVGQAVTKDRITERCYNSVVLSEEMTLTV